VLVAPLAFDDEGVVVDLDCDVLLLEPREVRPHDELVAALEGLDLGGPPGQGAALAKQSARLVP